MSLGIVFALALASLGAIVVFFNPQTISWRGPVLFSAAVFLSLFSLAAWLGLRLRQKFVAETNFRNIAAMSFRQGALLAALALGYLWLNHFNFFKA